MSWADGLVKGGMMAWKAVKDFVTLKPIQQIRMELTLAYRQDNLAKFLAAPKASTGVADDIKAVEAKLEKLVIQADDNLVNTRERLKLYNPLRIFGINTYKSVKGDALKDFVDDGIDMPGRAIIRKRIKDNNDLIPGEKAFEVLEVRYGLNNRLGRASISMPVTAYAVAPILAGVGDHVLPDKWKELGVKYPPDALVLKALINQEYNSAWTFGERITWGALPGEIENVAGNYKIVKIDGKEAVSLKRPDGSTTILKPEHISIPELRQLEIQSSSTGKWLAPILSASGMPEDKVREIIKEARGLDQALASEASGVLDHMVGYLKWSSIISMIFKALVGGIQETNSDGTPLSHDEILKKQQDKYSAFKKMFDESGKTGSDTTGISGAQKIFDETRKALFDDKKILSDKHFDKMEQSLRDLGVTLPNVSLASQINQNNFKVPRQRQMPGQTDDMNLLIGQ